MNFGVLDMKDADGILSMLEGILSKVYQPMMQAYNKWGELSNTPQGLKTINKFLDTMNGFVGYLQSM